MYFRYLLVAVLLACAYGNKKPEDNGPDFSCTCLDGGKGVACAIQDIHIAEKVKSHSLFAAAKIS